MEPGRLFVISYIPQRAPFTPAPCLSDRHYLIVRGGFGGWAVGEGMGKCEVPVGQALAARKFFGKILSESRGNRPDLSALGDLEGLVQCLSPSTAIYNRLESAAPATDGPG